MEAIIGLVMFYVWIHGTVIVVKKIHKPTTYEQVVLWVGLAGFALILIGIANS